MSQLIEKYSSDKVFKNVEALIKSLGSEKKVIAVTLVNITAVKGKTSWKYILLGVIFIVGINIFEKVSELIGERVIPPFLEKVFTSEGIAYILIGGLFAYIIYKINQYLNPKTDIAVLTNQNIFFIQEIKSSVHGVSSDHVLKVPLSSLKLLKELPSNILNTYWYLETVEEIPLNIWVKQNRLWNFRYRIGGKGVRLEKFVQTIRPKYLENKIKFTGGLSKLLSNLGGLINFVVPLLVIWMGIEVRNEIFIAGQKSKTDPIEKELEIKHNQDKDPSIIPQKPISPPVIIKKTIVPFLIGKTYRDAKKILQGYKLHCSAKYSSEYVLYSISNSSKLYDNYIVKSQYPSYKQLGKLKENNLVNEGSKIYLTLESPKLEEGIRKTNSAEDYRKIQTHSNSSEKGIFVTVPDLVTKTYKEAKKALESKNLRYKAFIYKTNNEISNEKDAEPFKVVAQDPKPIDKGSPKLVGRYETIKLYLSL